jgi:ATP-binding cassette subfamily B protein
MYTFSRYRGWFEINKNPVEQDKIRYTIRKHIYGKIYDLSAIQLESESEINEKFLIMNYVPEKFVAYFDAFSSLIGRFIMCISVFFVVLSIDKYVFLILLLPILSTKYFGDKLNKKQYECNQKSAAGNIKKNYVKRCYSGKKYVGEIKTTNINNALNGLYKDGSEEILANNRKFASHKVTFSFFIEIFKNRIPYSFILGYAVYQVMVAKKIGVVDISIVLIGLVNLSDRLGDFAGLFSSMKDSKRYIHDADAFLQKQSLLSESQPGQALSDFKEAISLSNVSFSYNKELLVLKNVNIQIHRGEKVAFVGKNGSGKTTLIKLLLRLYDPDGGEIKLDGKCVKQYDIKNYRDMFSTVQQDSKLFAFTVSDNIMSKKTNGDDQDIVKNSLEFCGLNDKIANTSNGINSCVSKEFDEEGIVLSGGEEKKLAIARACAKSAPIVVLDEPTSSLDPISEDEMLTNLLDICDGKTAIFVMHRLSFAKKMDRIYYFENGEILEVGSHKELMDFGGKYAVLFNKQAYNYLDNRKNGYDEKV